MKMTNRKIIVKIAIITTIIFLAVTVVRASFFVQVRTNQVKEENRMQTFTIGSQEDEDCDT